MTIDEVLESAERALEEGENLNGTGFWAAVGRLRRDRALAERSADRVARIDRRAFERGVRMRVPIVPGLLVLTATTAFGVVAVVAALGAGAPGRSVALLEGRSGVDLYQVRAFVPVAFLVGFGAILVGSHCLAHWLVGRALGIRFTHVFLGGPKPPRPGLKTDYASYLRAPPRARAAMHASGAVVTKIVPFALLIASFRLYDGWPWLTWILLTVGVVQIVTDVVVSTKVSDWKKVRRELRAAR